MEIAKPFIRLPYCFDAVRLAEEVTAIDDSAWMQHPTRMSGNSAVALLSRDGRDNDDFEGAMRETPHLQQCPYVRQVMASFGEVLGRSRLMKLAPASEVAQHVDFNYHWYTRVRIHIPVVTNPGVIFYCADQSVHMQAGECWTFNNWRRHRVVNGGDRERIHLVIDTAGSSRFWKVVRDMLRNGLDAVEGEGDQRIERVPFREGETPAIRAERYNIAPVMAPGELDALVQGLIADFEQFKDNDPELVDSYRQLLTDFAKDWRELWHLYGYRREGWPEYQALIDKTSGRLHPDRKALLTASNRIAVNPIIVQRILRSALATDQADQFVPGE